MARGQGGGSASAALVVVTVLALLQSALATNYPVNGDGTWGFGKNYQAWADGVSFAVGDSLEFKYPASAHSVFQLATKAAFDSCDISTPQQQWTSGDDTISLTAAGPAYFVCGVPTHCGAGMKFSVNVAPQAASPPTAPPTTPPAAPPSTPPATPPTTPSATPPTTPPATPPTTPPATPPSTPTPGKAPSSPPTAKAPSAKAPTTPAPPPGSSAGSVKAGLVTVAGAVALAMLV